MNPVELLSHQALCRVASWPSLVQTNFTKSVNLQFLLPAFRLPAALPRFSARACLHLHSDIPNRPVEISSVEARLGNHESGVIGFLPLPLNSRSQSRDLQLEFDLLLYHTFATPPSHHFLDTLLLALLNSQSINLYH